MTCSPFHALPTDLSDSDETLEQFYTEDKKSCLQLLCDSTASSDQLQNECIQQYTMLVSANIDMDDRVSNKSSPLMSTSLSGNRFFCPDEIDLMSWTNKHPEQWGPREVLDWVYCVADKCRISGIRGEMFNQKTGCELCRLSREQFMTLEPDYGSLLYGCLHKLLRNSHFQAPIHLDITATEASEKMDYETSWTDCLTETVHETTTLNSIAPPQVGGTVKLNGTFYDYDLKESFFDIEEESIEEESGYSTGESTTECDYVSSSYVEPAYCGVYYAGLPSTELLEEAMEQKPRKRSPGRPRKQRSNSDTSSDGEMQFSVPVGRKPGHVSKGNHLWEFVRDLLANPNCNPSLVRWEDEANGVFRFVRSEKVARLWGEKKNNKTMTYEKLSRAMRFCRSAGYFAEIPKYERFPKKLCFKFGPKAQKWGGV